MLKWSFILTLTPFSWVAIANSCLWSIPQVSWGKTVLLSSRECSSVVFEPTFQTWSISSERSYCTCTFPQMILLIPPESMAVWSLSLRRRASFDGDVTVEASIKWNLFDSTCLFADWCLHMCSRHLDGLPAIGFIWLCSVQSSSLM